MNHEHKATSTRGGPIAKEPVHCSTTAELVRRMECNAGKNMAVDGVTLRCYRHENGYSTHPGDDVLGFLLPHIDLHCRLLATKQLQQNDSQAEGKSRKASTRGREPQADQMVGVRMTPLSLCARLCCYH